MNEASSSRDWTQHHGGTLAHMQDPGGVEYDSKPDLLITDMAAKRAEVANALHTVRWLQILTNRKQHRPHGKPLKRWLPEPVKSGDPSIPRMTHGCQSSTCIWPQREWVRLWWRPRKKMTKTAKLEILHCTYSTVLYCSTRTVLCVYTLQYSTCSTAVLVNFVLASYQRLNIYQLSIMRVFVELVPSSE